MEQPADAHGGAEADQHRQLRDVGDLLGGNRPSCPLLTQIKGQGERSHQKNEGQHGGGSAGEPLQEAVHGAPQASPLN